MSPRNDQVTRLGTPSETVAVIIRRLLPATEVAVSTRAAGDLRPKDGVSAPLASLSPDRRLCWTRQVHGGRVILAEGESSRGEPADGLVAGEDGPSLAMFAADCALVAMASREGPRGVVHVGWRGLRAGIVAEAASLLREMGAGEIAALRGPCIGPECYEFGPAELDELARLFGDSVRSETAGGRPSLDLPAGVRCALAAAGVDLVSEFDSCTACGRFADGTSAWFSHRARGDSGRHAMVVGSVISHEGTARPD